MARPTQTAKQEDDVLSVTTTGAARLTGIAAATLVSLRHKGNGPPFVKVGRSVVYLVRDLQCWLEQKRVSSTADTARRSSKEHDEDTQKK